MSYRTSGRRRVERRAERRGGGNGCLRWIVALIWVVLLIILAYRFWLQPQISRQIGEEIGDRIGGAGAVGGGGGAGGALPTAIAALPPGELRVSERDVNDYISANLDRLQPIEAASVRFAGGRAALSLRAYGLEGTLSAGIVAQNGRIVTVDPRLDGPLSQVITVGDLLPPVEARLNEALAAQGRTFRSVEIGEGEIILQP